MTVVYVVQVGIACLDCLSRAIERVNKACFDGCGGSKNGGK
jgi:hypothetical protein